MTLAQKALLEPFANILDDWEQQIGNLSDANLVALRSACAAASYTNCWACSFHAAQVIFPMIRRVANGRPSLKPEAA